MLNLNYIGQLGGKSNTEIGEGPVNFSNWSVGVSTMEVKDTKDDPLVSVLARISGNLGSVPCSVTDFLCDLGKVT